MKYIIIIFALILCSCTVSEFSEQENSKVKPLDSCIGGSCIEDAFHSCKAIEKSFSFHKDIPLEVRTEIVGKDGDACIIKQEVIKDETSMGYVGKAMTCTIPQDFVLENIQDYCEGELLDAIIGVRA